MSEDRLISARDALELFERGSHGRGGAPLALARYARAGLLGAVARRVTYIEEWSGEGTHHDDVELDALYFADAENWNRDDWALGSARGRFDHLSQFQFVGLHFSRSAVENHAGALPEPREKRRPGRKREIDHHALIARAREIMADRPGIRKYRLADSLREEWKGKIGREPDQRYVVEIIDEAGLFDGRGN